MVPAFEYDSAKTSEHFMLTLLAQWTNQSPHTRESVPRISDLKDSMKQGVPFTATRHLAVAYLTSSLSLCFYAQLLHELGIWLSPPSTPNQTEDIRLQKARRKQDALKVQWCREAVKQIRSNHILHKQAARHNCPRKTAPSFSLSVYIFHVWVSGSRIPLVICASCAGKMLEERSKS